MLVVASAATLSHVLKVGWDPGLLPILHRYQPHLADELAVLFILQPGDGAANLEAVRHRPFKHWEFILAEGGWFEAVFVLDDYGHGHVVLIPDSDECDPELLNICREHAVSSG